jgi:hypothetical protein
MLPKCFGESVPLVLTPPCDINDSALIKLATSLSVINFLGLLGEVAVETPVN